MASYHLITAAQCRAARGLLGWTQQDLAAATGLSKTAIVQFETGLARTRDETLAQIVASLTHQGIEFIAPDGVNRRTVVTQIFADDQTLEEGWPVFLRSLNPQHKLVLMNWPQFSDEYRTMTGYNPDTEILTAMPHTKAAMIGAWLIVPLLETDYRIAIHAPQWKDPFQRLV